MKYSNILKKLQGMFFGREPVKDFYEIDKIEEKIGMSLPADYKYFLQWFSNGGETNTPLDYLRFLPIEEVLETQEDYQFEKWAPKLLIWGMEGDDAFCFDLESNKDVANYRIVRVSLSSRDMDEATTVADNFRSFLEN